MDSLKPVILPCDQFVANVIKMGKIAAETSGLTNPSNDDILFLGAKKLFVIQDDVHEVKSNNTTTAYQNVLYNCGTDATGNSVYRQLLLTFKDQKLCGLIMPTEKTLELFKKENDEYVQKFKIQVSPMKEGDATIGFQMYKDVSNKAIQSDIYQAIHILDNWFERIIEERQEFGSKLLAWCRENMTCTVTTITDYIRKTFPGTPIRYALVGDLRSKQILNTFKGMEIPPNILEVLDKVFVKFYGEKLAKHSQTLLKTGAKMDNPIVRLKVKSLKKEDKEKKTVTNVIVPTLKNADLPSTTPNRPNFQLFTNPDGSPLTKDFVWKAVNNKTCLLGSFKFSQIIYSGNYISYEANVYDMILQTNKSAFSKIADEDLYGSDAIGAISQPQTGDQPIAASDDVNAQVFAALNGVAE